MFPKQGDRPFDRLVTVWLRTMAHTGAKDVLKLLIPNRGAISPAVVYQGGGIPSSLKATDPMVDGHATGPQETSGLCDRTPAVDFEDRKDTAKQTRISSGS